MSSWLSCGVGDEVTWVALVIVIDYEVSTWFSIDRIKLLSLPSWHGRRHSGIFSSPFSRGLSC